MSDFPKINVGHLAMKNMSQKWNLEIDFGTPNTWLVINEIGKKLKTDHPEFADSRQWKQLWSIHVSRQLRGQGIGGELMQRSCNLADTLGFGLVLRCQPFNGCKMTCEQLQAFYAEYGFESTQKDPNIMFRGWHYD